MRKLVNVCCMVGIMLLSGSVTLYGGQNAGAGIRIDFDYLTSGNQNDNMRSPVSSGQTIWVEVHVIGASNLDTYEFDINYPSTQMNFNMGFHDNPFSGELNFLKKNGGSTVGGVIIDYGTYVNVANELIGNQGVDTPDGVGLLALLSFVTTTTANGQFTFGDVDWYDNEGVFDACLDKGDASLPVKMTDMTATADNQTGVTLSWQTASELDCAGFHLLKSVDNVAYERITTQIIQSKGNGSTAQQYEFIDKNVEDKKLYWYKIEEVSTKGVSIFYGPLTVEGISPIPTDFDLSQNYPNPFNPKTTLKYQLPEDCDVSIRVFNLLGKEVRSLYNKNQKAGYYSVQWNGMDDTRQMMPSGIYIIQMIAGDFHQVRKINLMR